MLISPKVSSSVMRREEQERQGQAQKLSPWQQPALQSSGYAAKVAALCRSVEWTVAVVTLNVAVVGVTMTVAVGHAVAHQAVGPL